MKLKHFLKWIEVCFAKITEMEQFANDEFSCTDWVNSVTSSNTSNNNNNNNTNSSSVSSNDALEARLAELIVTLQTSAADVNAAIDATTTHALTGIPRSVREIERVRSEASLRARKLDAVAAQQLHADAAATGRSDAFVARLAHLDSVKQRVESTAALLRQARRVYESLAALPVLLARVDPTAVDAAIDPSIDINASSSSSSLNVEVEHAARLAAELRALERALAALRHVSHFDNARTVHSDATRRLETALAPRVQRALESRDAQSTRALLDLFDQMGASDAFVQLYYACRERELEALWRSHAPPPLAESDDATPKPTTTTADTPLVQRLQAFYDAALVSLQEEARWLEQALPPSMPPVVLAAFVVRALTTLAKPISRDIERALARVAAAKRLDALIDVRDIAQRFALAAGALVPERRRVDVHEAALRPLRPSVALYEELAYAQLSAQVDSLRLVDPPANADYGQTLRRCRSTLAPLFLAANGSIERCQKLTQLASGAALVRALQRVLVEHASGIDRVITWARRKSRLDALSPTPPSTTATTAAAAQGPTAAAAAAAAANANAAANTAVADAENYDWTFLQGAFELLSAAAEFSMRLQTLETTVRDSLLGARDELMGSANKASEVPDTPVRRDAARVSELSTVLRSLADGARALPQAASSAATIRSGAQTFVFDTMLWFARQRLLEVPTLAQWTASKHVDTSLPDFSLAPSQYVMQVGEHLLSLPQQLAPHAEVRAPDGEAPPLLLPAAEHAPAPDDDADEGARWARAWLGAVARQLMQLYVRKLLEIRALSQFGRAQLAADVSYLSNVVDALGIEADEQIRFVHRFCTTPPSEFARLVAETTQPALANVAKRLAAVSQH
jgi:hypothetical protein